MKIKTIIELLILMFFSCQLTAQQINYSVSFIPDSLTENADAVVRYKSTEFNIIDESSAIFTEKIAITILNQAGTEYAPLMLFYDKFKKIKKLSGVIYDKNGKAIEKIKKNDFGDFSMLVGSSLFDDTRILRNSKPIYNPPYTVEYEYVINYNGLLAFSYWAPIDNENVSVQFSKIKVTAELPYYFSVQLNNFGDSSGVKKMNTFFLKKTLNIKVVKSELYSYLYSSFPYIIISPNIFSIDGYHGQTSSWEKFGNWILKLNEGRNDLPQKTIDEVIALTKMVSDTIEKAKLIYEYMQNKTHYISVQVGIGGWQPFLTSETDRNGYGDCKALSFYTQALLDIVDIKSYYTLVSAGADAKKMDINFVSSQFNHAILCLPLQNDTIWLECTSQTNPFGFLGSFTDDRDVLIIKPSGGEVAHTTKYDKNDNIQTRVATVDIDLDGEIYANVLSKYKGVLYSYPAYVSALTNNEIKEQLMNNTTLRTITVNDFSYSLYKEKVPCVEESFSFEATGFGSVMGDKILVPINFMKKFVTQLPNNINRKTDIYFRRELVEIDTVIYNVPENYIVVNVPQNEEISNQFGFYSLKFLKIDDTFIIIRRFERNKGNFPLSSYVDFEEFYKKIYVLDGQKFVIQKIN